MVILLVVSFSAYLIMKNGFVNQNAETAAIVSIAIMSVVYPMYLSVVSTYKDNQVRKTIIVTGTSFESLEINLNKELKKMKGKTIISVQVINNKQSLIVYTD